MTRANECAEPPGTSHPVQKGVRRSPGVILEPPAEEKLVLDHLPQVRLVARSLWERTRFAVELDDLIGYGTLGLVDAVRKFDPRRGVMLKTYAEHRIRGAILDGLRGMDWLSRSARRQAKATAAEGPAESTASGGAAGGRRTPFGNAPGSAGERKLGASPTTLIRGGGVGDIEKLYQNARPPADWHGHQPTPEKLLEHAQRRSALSVAMDQLPERQRLVLDLYYRQERSMKQIAALLGVHESRVSQIHLAAITRLRKTLDSKLGPGKSESSGAQLPAGGSSLPMPIAG